MRVRSSARPRHAPCCVSGGLCACKSCGVMQRLCGRGFERHIFHVEGDCEAVGRWPHGAGSQGHHTAKPPAAFQEHEKVMRGVQRDELADFDHIWRYVTGTGPMLGSGDPQGGRGS